MSKRHEHFVKLIELVILAGVIFFLLLMTGCATYTCATYL